MQELLNFLAALWSDEEGQGMVEYGLILALIAVVVIAVISAIGTHLTDQYQKIDNSINPDYVPPAD